MPGVASTVRALMTSQPRSQVQVQAMAQDLRPTVPRLRGQGLARGTVSGQSTLGAPDADARQGAMEAVLADDAGGLQGGGGQGGVAQGAGEAAAPGQGWPALATLTALGDARQVRVEADTRLNAVIVRDAPERLGQYEQLIQALDVEPQSLEIEATIV